MSAELSEVEARWVRLGVWSAHRTSAATPDLERLILDTARWSPASPRLFVTAVTWLSRYASLVAEHRLAAMVAGDAGAETVPALGLLLELAIAHARRNDRRRNLRRALRRCRPAERPAPLFDAERTTPGLIERAERRASDVSRRWNRWTEPLSPKYDALRPAEWIIGENPTLAFRADFRGDLRASILLVLRDEPEAGATASGLARRCLASRTAVLDALEDLALGGHLRRETSGRASRAVLPAA
jgi:hypothetical protein